MTIEQIKEFIITALEAGDTARATELENDLVRLREAEARQWERAELQAKADKRKALKLKAAELAEKVKAEARPIEHFLEERDKLLRVVDTLLCQAEGLKDEEKKCLNPYNANRYDDEAKQIPVAYLPTGLTVSYLSSRATNVGQIAESLTYTFTQARQFLAGCDRQDHLIKGTPNLEVS